MPDLIYAGFVSFERKSRRFLMTAQLLQPRGDHFEADKECDESRARLQSALLCPPRQCFPLRKLRKLPLSLDRKFHRLQVSARVLTRVCVFVNVCTHTGRFARTKLSGQMACVALAIFHRRSTFRGLVEFSSERAPLKGELFIVLFV